MTKTIKSLKTQYKNYTIYQSSCAKSPSGYVQLIVNNTNHHKIEKEDNIIVRSTKKQLYRYLKWVVNNDFNNDSLDIIDWDNYPIIDIGVEDDIDDDYVLGLDEE